VNLRSKLVGNAAIYLGANILNAGIPFLLMPILTRVLTPADYGTIAMFGVMLTALSAFTGLSVHGAVGVRYFQLEKKELAEYVGTCVGILVVSTSVVFLLVAAFGSWLTEISGVSEDWLLVAVILSGVQLLGQIRLSLWQASGQAKKYGIFQISQSLFNGTLSLIFILILGMAWQGRLLGQTLAGVAFGIVALCWLFKDGLLTKGVAWRVQSMDALKFGVPLIPHVIGGVVISTGGQFLVTRLLGVSETGLYVLAFQFGAVFGLASDAFVKVYGPWLYGRLKDDSYNSRLFVVGVTYIVFFAFFLSSVLFSFVVYFLFDFFVGAKFLSARELVFLFVIGNGFVGMYYAVAGFFFFTSKTKFVSMVTFFSGFISLLLMFCLGRIYGLVGFAIGFLASQILTFVLAWIISAKIFPMPWLHMMAGVTMVLSRAARR
jgi:O-antigen/teichoic acid export membrane protein